LILCAVETNLAGKITSLTAITIAIGLGIYGLVCMVTGNPGGIITILIAGWVIWQSKGLYECAQRKEVHTHPLFARDCLLHQHSSTTSSDQPVSQEAQSSMWGALSGANSKGANGGGAAAPQDAVV
jgi:hypothetical protein